MFLPGAFDCTSLQKCMPNIAASEPFNATVVPDEPFFWICNLDERDDLVPYGPGMSINGYACADPTSVYCRPKAAFENYHIQVQSTMERYTCPATQLSSDDPRFHNVYFNDMASLLFSTGESAIHTLFTRGTAGSLG